MVLFALFFLIFFLNSVYAGGISVSPSELEFMGKDDTKQIIVYNSNEKKAEFSISAPEWFDFDQRKFSIEPNAMKKVSVKATPKSSGTFSSYIFVSEDGNADDNVAIRLSAAVRARVKVKHEPSIIVGAAISSSIVALGLVGYRKIRSGGSF